MARENYEKYGHPDGPQALNMVCPAFVFCTVQPLEPALVAQYFKLAD